MLEGDGSCRTGLCHCATTYRGPWWGRSWHRMRARETVKVTVRIFHKEKPLFRGEAAYHNGMRIPWAGDRKLSSLLKQAALAAHLDFLSESLVWCFLLLKLHQQLEDGLQCLLSIPREMLQHQLECFYMLSVSVILQSISDVNCTQGVGFLLIIFYCRIIHIPSGKDCMHYYFSQGNC